MTVLGDGMRGVVLVVSESRDINSAQTVLECTLGDKITEIETVSTDKWKLSSHREDARIRGNADS